MSSILFEIKEHVACITLNRPDKFNSFNREMALNMQARLDECASVHDIRAVYITGDGRAFSAGQDLGELVGDDPIGLEVILSEHYNPIIQKIRNMPKPVVAAVNGVAAGAGANIALACDIVVAVESASFIQAFSKIGLIPDSGGTFFLPRLVGFQKASALMMLGEKVSAAEAERIGMIYAYYPEEIFAQESMKIAETLSNMPTKGLTLTKHALNYSYDHTVGRQLLREDEYQQKAAATADYQEGVAAFLEKRKPVFTGQ